MGAICTLVLVPLLTIVASFLIPADEAWFHFVQTSLWEVIGNTLLLLCGVLLGSFIIGVGLAWLTSACEFPGRCWLEWALILPFAFPTYVLGHVMIEFFGRGGPLHAYLSQGTGRAPAWYPDVTSIYGLVLVMSLAFYPYVYLLARTAFRTHGRRTMEAAQALGHTPMSAFFRLIMPMARPWIFGGLLLVAMETLADFGTVAIFNYDTFTTSIYKAWFSMYSVSTASRMATILLIFAMLLLYLERYARSNRRYYPLASSTSSRTQLRGVKRWAALFSCLLVLNAGFLLPFARLAWWSSETWLFEADALYWSLALNTLKTGLSAAVLIGAGALLLCYALRVQENKVMASLSPLATMGYALPGSVLAVGIYIPLIWLDNFFLDRLEEWGFQVEDLLGDTLAVMLAAYFVRFLALAYQPVHASLERLKPSLDETARSLAHSRLSILFRIHLPIIRTGLVTAMLLVLIDVMKEMPITLMARPYDWQTLSTRIFELTSEGEYQRAALPSAMLVMAGLIPVLLLGRYSEAHLDGSNS